MQLVRKGYFCVAVIVCFLIVLKSLDYFYPDFSSGFLIGKAEIFVTYRFFLYAHIVAAPIAFLTGIFQFSFKKSAFHKLAGKIYVVSVLFFAAPGALFMALFAFGGIPAVLNFSIMAGCWIWFTVQAYQSIRQGKTRSHHRWIIRSFILTNSAIAIRIFSFISNQLDIMDPGTRYVIISWMSWLPVLLIYEWHLKRKSVIPV